MLPAIAGDATTLVKVPVILRCRELLIAGQPVTADAAEIKPMLNIY